MVKPVLAKSPEHPGDPVRKCPCDRADGSLERTVLWKGQAEGRTSASGEMAGERNSGSLQVGNVLPEAV